MISSNVNKVLKVVIYNYECVAELAEEAFKSDILSECVAELA